MGRKKDLFWISSSKKDLLKFPKTVQDSALFYLDLVREGDAIYVLHAFQKKSKKGIETTKQDMDLIRQRLQIALADHKERSS